MYEPIDNEDDLSESLNAICISEMDDFVMSPLILHQTALTLSLEGAYAGYCYRYVKYVIFVYISLMNFEFFCNIQCYLLIFVGTATQEHLWSEHFGFPEEHSRTNRKHVWFFCI